MNINNNRPDVSVAAATAAVMSTAVPVPTAAAAASAAAVAYDAAGTADTWSKRPVPVVARLAEIVTAFGGWWLRAQLHRDERRAAADMRQVSSSSCRCSSTSSCSSGSGSGSSRKGTCGGG